MQIADRQSVISLVSDFKLTYTRTAAFVLHVTRDDIDGKARMLYDNTHTHAHARTHALTHTHTHTHARTPHARTLSLSLSLSLSHTHTHTHTSDGVWKRHSCENDRTTGRCNHHDLKNRCLNYMPCIPGDGQNKTFRYRHTLLWSVSYKEQFPTRIKLPHFALDTCPAQTVLKQLENFLPSSFF